MINEQSPSQTSDSEPTKCIIVHILIIILHPHLHLPPLGIKSPKLKQNNSSPILPYSGRAIQADSWTNSHSAA